MWKMLRLASLCLLAVVLGVLSFPTWRPLFTPERAPINYRFGEVASVTVPYGTSESDLYIASDYERSQTAPGTDFTSDLVLTVYNQGDPGPIYVFASGKARQLFERCHVSEGEFRPIVSGEAVPDSFKSATNATFYVWRTSGLPRGFGELRCNLLFDQLWTDNNGSLNFSAPIVDVRPSYPAVSGKQPGKQCAGVAVRYPPGYAPQYQSAPSDDSSSARRIHFFALEAPSASWVSCGSEEVGNGIGARSMGLTDIAETARYNRSLFFAGAFAGILGGLALEIVGTSFDVAEQTVRRRRRGQDSAGT